MVNFGVSAALATPIGADGKVAMATLIAQARRSLDAGCSSITLFGTTGEGCSVGSAERAEILSAVLAAGIVPAQIVVGVLVDAAEDAAMQAAQALRSGVKNILLAPPSYFKNVSDDGLFDWFSSVLQLLGNDARDVLVYNIPSVTMVPLSVDLIGRLHAAYPDAVVGVKDSSGDWAYTEILLQRYAHLIILIGDERHLARGVRLGGQGAISGMANFVPREVLAMVADGRDDKRVEDFVGELLKYPVTAAVKAMVARTTGDDVWLAVRPPLVQISDEGRARLSSAFEALFKAKAA